MSEGIKIDFVGYEETQFDSKILKLIKGDEFVSIAEEGDEVEVITEKTPFYGEAGGQVGRSRCDLSGKVLHGGGGYPQTDGGFDCPQGKGEKGSGEGRDGGKSQGGFRSKTSHCP